MEENEASYPLRLDEKIQTPQMKAIKAMIPYMEPAMGKKAAFAVKILEIRNLLAIFDNEIAIHGEWGTKTDDAVLSAIKPYCNEEMVEIIGFWERLMELQKMVELMSAMSDSECQGMDEV